jgi:hypothetical protein
MKKSMTLALAASIFTLALAANPHTSEVVVMGILGDLYSVVFS